jgi:CTP synthase
MVGKYVSLTDSYVSVNEALSHAAARMNFTAKLEWVESEDFEKDKNNLEKLNKYNGIIVPGGFGKRGTEGIMLAADYARKNEIPFLGLCFGFQLALIAFARYACGLDDANSIELDPKTKNPIINILPSQKKIKEKGGSMRLGGHDIELVKNTRAHKIYGKDKIRQRHRHRFEFNQEYQELLEKNKIVLSGFSDNGRRTEILEIPNHRFYMATQYHPEFLSKPGKPEPIYYSFIKAVTENKSSNKK